MYNASRVSLSRLQRPVQRFLCAAHKSPSYVPFCVSVQPNPDTPARYVRCIPFALFHSHHIFLVDLSAQLSGIDLCRFRNLFLLILLLVGSGLDMGAVNENCVRIDHTVIECLVENMLENLTGQLVRKALAEGIAHRRKVWNVIQQSIPQKPAVGQIYLNFPLGLPQRRNAKQMLNEHHLDQHNRIGSGVSVVMAIVRVKSFIQPFVIHDPYTRI